MSEKKVGKRLLTWVLVLVMTLSLLPLNVLAAHPVGPAKVIRPDDNKYLTYQFYVGEDKVAEQIIKTRRYSAGAKSNCSGRQAADRLVHRK